MPILIIIITIIAASFLTGFSLDPFIPLFNESRSAKEYIAFIGACLVAYYGLRHSSLKCYNRWPLIFVFYTLLTLELHPGFRLILWSHNINGFWMYPVAVKCLVYYLMWLTISNIELDVKKIFAVIFYCGSLTALYVILQACHHDQLFALRPQEIVLASTQPNLTGFMGQNTLAAAFIALAVPFGFYFERYVLMGIMILACLLTCSKMAIIALCVGLFLYSLLRSVNRTYVFYGTMAFLVAIPLCLALFIGFHKIMPDNGRFGHWKAVLADMSAPQITDVVPDAQGDPVLREAVEVNNEHTWNLTGIGPGAYPYIFVNKYQSPWQQIHNEYLEVMYGWGDIGFVIFLFMIASFLQFLIWDYLPIEMHILLSSLVIILLCALTNFIWQVEPIAFITIVIVGMLHNPKINKGG